MPQKRSSQLYSVTPKTFVRKRRKKQGPKRNILIPSLVTGGLLLVFLLVLFLIFSYQSSGIISPLQVAVGQKLQTFSGDKSENDLKRLLSKHDILYTHVTPQGSDYIISLNAKQQVFLTKKKDIESQISSLQVILPRLTMEGREFHRLDMRYDKPVVTY